MLFVLSITRFTIEHEILPLFWQLLERDICGNLEMAARPQQILLAIGALAGEPRFDHAFRQRFRAVRNSQVIIDADYTAKPAARRTGADRVVEAEQGRGGLAVFDIALRTMQTVAEAVRIERGDWSVRRRFRHGMDSESAFAEVIRLFAGFYETGAVGMARFQAILDDRETGQPG